MPHHVTDDQRDAAVGQRDRVEPVAAGRLLLPGHQVPGRDPGPRQDRQGGWQQRFLQFRHYPRAAGFPRSVTSVAMTRSPLTVPSAARRGTP